MKLSVFVGTSLDGFIARRNGQYDFLPPGGGEPHGYKEFIASVDTILIGRNTFEVVLKLLQSGDSTQNPKPETPVPDYLRYGDITTPIRGLLVTGQFPCSRIAWHHKKGRHPIQDAGRLKPQNVSQGC